MEIVRNNAELVDMSEFLVSFFWNSFLDREQQFCYNPSHGQFLSNLYLDSILALTTPEAIDVSESDLDTTIERIVVQIAKKLGRPRFNHYRPANLLAKKGLTAKDLSADTLNRFDAVFEKMNQLFDSK